jgi:hypothetical protein
MQGESTRWPRLKQRRFSGNGMPPPAAAHESREQTVAEGVARGKTRREGGYLTVIRADLSRPCLIQRWRQAPGVDTVRLPPGSDRPPPSTTAMPPRTPPPALLRARWFGTCSSFLRVCLSPASPASSSPSDRVPLAAPQRRRDPPLRPLSLT